MFNIYFHLCTASNWKKSFNIIYDHLLKSGILNDCEDIIYSVNGDISEAQEYLKNIATSTPIFLAHNTYDEEFEFPTINLMLNDLSKKDMKALYIMNKGATAGINQAQKDHIDVMSHFNIHKYEKCLSLLDEYDAVGVDYHTEPFKHFSGNFWWSKSSHVKKLPPLYFTPDRVHAPLGQERHAAEAWVCSIDGKFKSMHDTHIPVFERHLHEYPPEKYID